MPFIVEIERYKDDDGEEIFFVKTYYVCDSMLLEGLSEDGESDWLEGTVGATEQMFEQVITKGTVRKLMEQARLSDLELEILRRVFWHETSLNQVAKELGKSYPWIRQNYLSALSKLKEAAKSFGLL